MSDLKDNGEMIDKVTARFSRRRLSGVDLATVVLTMIRTLTPAMERAFYAACDEHGNVLWRYGHKAMIDALLASEEAA